MRRRVRYRIILCNAKSCAEHPGATAPSTLERQREARCSESAKHSAAIARSTRSDSANSARSRRRLSAGSCREIVVVQHHVEQHVELAEVLPPVTRIPREQDDAALA